MNCIYVLLISFIFVSKSQQKTKPPHIVFILADDLGWNDVSFHGSQQIQTPNLDTLAYDGILLSNYYVQPICTPTRGALLTGRHPIHIGLQRSVIVGSQPYGLPLNETTMPQYLKTLGYKTHIIGKWHLGFYALDYTPIRRGFDSHFGYYSGMEDYWEHTYEAAHNLETWGLDFRRNDEIVKTDFGQYSTELFANEALNVIKNHDSNHPLFLYLPFQAVHSGNAWKPLEVPKQYYNRFPHIKDRNRRTFAGMVSALDDAVGNVTKALHDKGLLNDTIIVFSTDNGGPPAGFDWNYANNYPLRGGKDTVWEGGMRGSAFIWSPLLQKSGYKYNCMMQVTDWLPTLLTAAGYDMTRLPKNVDGISQWYYLNHQFSNSMRTAMLHNVDTKPQHWAMRYGDMKIIHGKGNTQKWNSWYKPEGENKDRDSEQTMKLNRKFGVSQIAPSDVFYSSVRPLLHNIGRGAPEGEPLVIICGDKPLDAAVNCKAGEDTCLYNITADPCEYHNLANKMPELVKMLMFKLKAYNDTSVPPGNKPQDPAGFPIHHGGIWMPWIKLNQSQLNTHI